MFVFGDPADTAKIWLNMIMDTPGPDIPDIHIDEMSEEELRNLNAWLHAALTHALRHDLDEPATEVLREWYDEVFIKLARVSERFRERVFDGSVLPPGGPEVRWRYVQLAKAASES